MAISKMEEVWSYLQGDFFFALFGLLEPPIFLYEKSAIRFFYLGA